MKLKLSRLALALLLAGAAGGANAQVVISQVYGGGGNTGAPYNRDYVELFNRGTASVSLDGLTVQYASATGTGAFAVGATLPNVSLAPGQYYLVGMASGANGAALPTVDTSGTSAMSGTAGKVILANSTAAVACNGSSIPCLPAQSALIIDLVGFGTANFYEGSAAAPTLSNITAALRGSNGCADTNQNGNDFTAVAPAPRNTATALAACGGPSIPTLSIYDVSLSEGNAGTTSFTFTISLSAPAPAGGVTFDIATADGTATTANNDYAAKSLTSQTIPAGSSTYSFTVLVNGDTAVEGNEGFLVNISNVVGATVGDASGLGTILNDDAAAAAIHDIQGNGSESPRNSTAVTTSGIVTAKRSNGFFMQTPDASVDADPQTSEAIFVFTGSAPTYALGDGVQVTGTVSEYAGPSGTFNMPGTQLSPSNMVLMSSNNALPAAIEITAAMLGANSLPDVLEHLEGMRVSVASGKIVAQSPGNTYEDSVTSSDLNGEFEIVIAGVQRPLREAGISIFDPYPAASTVPLFDANQERLKVYPLVVPPGGTPRVDAGGTISGLVGVLTYYGSNFAESAWELLYDADSPPTIVSGTAQAVSDPAASDITIAGYNMLRLFDDIGSNPTISTANFDKRVTKAAAVICDWLKTPDILGAVEVENLNTLNTLATKLNDTCASEPQYVAYLEEGNDVGGIDVGFLVNTRAAGAVSRVQMLEVEQHGKTTTWTEPGGGTSLLNDRPPLRLKARVTLDDGRTYPITAIVVHQRSLNSNDAVGATGNRVRAKRAKQAEFLAQLVHDLQTADPDEKIVLVGDFNGFDVNDGYVDVMGITTGNPALAPEVVFWADSPLASANGGTPLIMGNELIADPEQRYSYIFSNISQSLDHAVVNEALLLDPAVADVIVDHARVNADFRHGHFSEFNPPYSVDNPPLRTSDHDPVRVVVRLAADSSAPAISYVLNPAAPNGSGWYTGDVLVDWTVIDPDSTITGSTGCDDTTLSSDTAGAAFTCTAVSAGGSSSVTTTTIKRDATAPTLAPTTPSPLLRGQSYVASPNASDATSDVASSSCGALDTSTTGSKSTSCMATDNAGNVATVILNYTVTTTCVNDGYKSTQLTWCRNICEMGYTGATLDTWIHRWIGRYRDLPYCLVNPQPQPQPTLL